ncbi:MAG: type II secretion system protein N, partial [Gammaproteobacteria bacterium]
MELTSKFNALTASSASSKKTLMRYGPMVLTALLVIWCASKLASITWMLLDKPKYDISTMQTVSAPVPSADGSQALNEQVSVIRNANLFGAYVAPPQGELANIQPDEEVPETQLTDLTLKGTVASTSDDNGLAVVERSGEENVFVIGDDIAPGIKLSRVFATEIHLSRNGVIEKLLLPKLSEAQPSSSRSNRSSSRGNRRPATRQVAATQRSAGNTPTKLGDLMRPQPVFQNGKMQGYRVYP